MVKRSCVVNVTRRKNNGKIIGYTCTGMSKMGRPTKYDPKLVDEVYGYIQESKNQQTQLPKIESLAIRLNVSKDTLYEWAKLYPDFSDALVQVMLLQGERLIDDGIYGGKEVNATIVKLLLQNNHGMKERVDQTTNDKDLEPVLVKFLNDANDRDTK